jgi:hypothetical protein
MKTDTDLPGLNKNNKKGKKLTVISRREANVGQEGDKIYPQEA